VEDHHVDRPDVEAQQCVKLTGTNSSIGLIVLKMINEQGRYEVIRSKNRPINQNQLIKKNGKKTKGNDVNSQ